MPLPMEPTRAELESLDRETLITRAELAGVARPRVLTRPELVDEILLRQENDPAVQRRARGLLGRARDLLARLVERGLNRADAAERVRDLPPPPPKRSIPPVPTVTLAEIYATQGYKQKAVDTLNQVLAGDPEHEPAKTLLASLGTPAATEEAPPLPVDGSAEGGTSPREIDERVGYEIHEGPSDTPSEVPPRMLDAEPLPPKYDVDECVALGVDPATLFVYWEVRGETYARLALHAGQLTVRILIIVPTWDGPRTTTRDVPVDAPFGDWFVRDLPKDAVLRAAIGWLTPEGGFLPAAHSTVAQVAPRDRAPVLTERLSRWMPEVTVPVRPGEADAEVQRVEHAIAQTEARSEARRIAASLALGGSEETWFSTEEETMLGASERLARARAYAAARARFVDTVPTS